MKRALIGAFFGLIGGIGILAVHVTVSPNLVSGWSTPPGRFLTTVSQLSLGPVLFFSFLIFTLGMIAMAIEYFKKDR